jgi:hypothetical protein
MNPMRKIAYKVIDHKYPAPDKSVPQPNWDRIQTPTEVAPGQNMNRSTGAARTTPSRKVQGRS